jgi:acetaldehyde dehydrogenase/alcohol dehydrogenase
VSVNAGASLGGAGLETNLAPSMTIGTGYVGRSSMGENLQPSHLVNPVRLAWNADAAVGLPPLDVAGLWQAPAGPVPPYPYASNDPRVHDPAGFLDHDREGGGGDGGREALSVEAAELREEIRRLVVEELRAIVRG